MHLIITTAFCQRQDAFHTLSFILCQTESFVIGNVQKEAEERLEAAKAGNSDNPVVTDLEMARNMGQKEDRVSSMRMQKKKVRRK